MRSSVIPFLAAAVFIGSPLAAQQQQPVAQQATNTESARAAYAGWTAGASKSTTSHAFLAGTTSVLAPGSGFLYLLFLHSGEVKPNFAEQAFLRDKSPEYTRVWVENYDRAATGKQKRTIVIASTIGSVAGYFLIYKPLFDRPSY